MNLLHLHLILNHVPIIGLLIANLLLLWATISKQLILKKTATVMIVVCAALTLPVYFSGEPAEHGLEKTVQLSESVIEAHEEAAELAVVLTSVSGVLALLSLTPFLRNSLGISSLVGFALLACSIGSSASLMWTGYLGGQIRHTEIQSSPLNSSSLSEESEDDEKEHALSAVDSAGNRNAAQSTVPADSSKKTMVTRATALKPNNSNASSDEDDD